MLPIRYRNWRFGSLVVVVLLSMVTGVIAAPPLQDQGEIEAIALRIHLDNTRTTDFTIWPGGDLGTNIAVKPTWKLGTPLADITFAGLGEGQDSLSLDDLTRPTLFSIWASWCSPCIQEFPLVTQVALAPEDHGYDVVFVNSYDEKDTALEFLSGQRQGIRSVSDPEGVLAAMVGAVGIPAGILIDANHRVMAIHLGNYTSSHAALFEILARDPKGYTGTFDPVDRPAPVPYVEIVPFEPADTTPIEVGEAVEGAITADAVQQVYTFEGQAGARISVRMEANKSLDYGMNTAFGREWSAGRDLEPYVVILAPDGEYLAESHDFSAKTYAHLDGITLPSDGVYTVVATRYMGERGISAGEYTLVITGQKSPGN